MKYLSSHETAPLAPQFNIPHREDTGSITAKACAISVTYQYACRISKSPMNTFSNSDFPG
jgi:hypothetical protein